MQISVSGRGLRVSEAQQEYARSKLTKLSHFFDKIQSADVIVSKEGVNFAVEIIVKPDHHDILVGRNRGPDVQSCVDVILDKLERQVSKYKEKIRNHKHHQTNRGEAPSVQ